MKITRYKCDLCGEICDANEIEFFDPFEFGISVPIEYVATRERSLKTTNYISKDETNTKLADVCMSCYDAFQEFLESRKNVRKSEM